MAVKIRLRLQGKRDRSFFRIVVADSRLPRDGKYLEKLGWYDPFNETKKAELNGERLEHWLSVGAILSPQAQSIAKKIQPEVLKRHLAKKLAQVAKKREAKKARAKRSKVASPKVAVKKAAVKKVAKAKKAETATEA